MGPPAGGQGNGDRPVAPGYSQAASAASSSRGFGPLTTPDGYGRATKGARNARAAGVSVRWYPPAPPEHHWLPPQLVSPTRRPSSSSAPPESPKHVPPPSFESLSLSWSFTVSPLMFCSGAVVNRRVRSRTAVGVRGVLSGCSKNTP